METIKCPTCPACDTEPRIVISPVQVFCGNDDCPVATWDTTQSRNSNLDTITFHVFPRNVTG